MERLKELRKEKKITQLELSKQLNIARSTYAQYELGQRQPDMETIINIANYFNVSVDYLLGNDFKRNRSTEALKFEQNVKALGPDYKELFYDLAGLNPDEIIEARNYIEYIKSKKKKG